MTDTTPKIPTPLEVLCDYVERSTHWREGGADRHAALQALRLLKEEGSAMPIGSVHRVHTGYQEGPPWCKSVLLYSPNNTGDRPDTRVMLYTAGRLSDALVHAENDRAAWRADAETQARYTKAAQATARVAIGHLQAVLNKARTHAEQQAADTAARDWLTSIGSEPT